MKTESTNERDPKPGIMSNSLIQTLVNNYRQNHMSAINETLGIQDAHSIWFDLPKLKKFISIIEEEAGKLNQETSEGDLGIRFYYAAYPKIENWEIMKSHPVAEEYAGKHTLVLIPTLKKADGTGEIVDFDFNPFQANGENSKLALNALNFTPIGNGDGDGGPLGDDTGLGENNGQLTPPKNSLGESY
ncbi:hypothetical protein [Chryseobacterium sp. PMSZPI]|uniref:hypothetical protein n=1 Tax=Chryseobacterium sp. PMSZPI TaxID=1033900 RepID=UPI000C343498|nr:hypothetical protein [Chryseobacterium sp. PMSZPI]PKF72409.1 hypothetical protein CW752_15925 [Chryseobacterium sp. PMSZPI]